jgi:hypothetical protein
VASCKRAAEHVWPIILPGCNLASLLLSTFVTIILPVASCRIVKCICLWACRDTHSAPHTAAATMLHLPKRPSRPFSVLACLIIMCCTHGCAVIMAPILPDCQTVGPHEKGCGVQPFFRHTLFAGREERLPTNCEFRCLRHPSWRVAAFVECLPVECCRVPCQKRREPKTRNNQTSRLGRFLPAARSCVEHPV